MCIRDRTSTANCANQCCSRTISNTNRCGLDDKFLYVFYVADGLGNFRRFQVTDQSTVTWEECEDGSIHYTAENLVDEQGSNEVMSLDFMYSGRTLIEQGDGHKSHSCLDDYSTAGWVYYPNISGTFTSNLHGTHTIQRRGPAFQMGYGANVTSSTLDFGACQWFDIIAGGDGTW